MVMAPSVLSPPFPKATVPSVSRVPPVLVLAAVRTSSPSPVLIREVDPVMPAAALDPMV